MIGTLVRALIPARLRPIERALFRVEYLTDAEFDAASHGRPVDCDAIRARIAAKQVVWDGGPWS